MSGRLESGPSDLEEPDELLSLAEAAKRLGCHVETLRLRVRDGRLEVFRGRHGRYYVYESEIDALDPPRRSRRRQLSPDDFSRMVPGYIDQLLNGLYRPMAWQRLLITSLRDNPAADRALYHSIAVDCLFTAGYTAAETAEAVGISERQVRRLRRETLASALNRAHARLQRAERGRVRRSARELVNDIRARLVAKGFRPARRDPRRANSGARGGQTARVALVRELRVDQRRSLRAVGLSDDQVAAISLLGIGWDEFNELVLRGLPDTTRPC